SVRHIAADFKGYSILPHSLTRKNIERRCHRHSHISTERLKLPLQVCVHTDIDTCIRHNSNYFRFYYNPFYHIHFISFCLQCQDTLPTLDALKFFPGMYAFREKKSLDLCGFPGAVERGLIIYPRRAENGF